MPTFYFHLFNDAYVPDQEGHEFPDLESAHADALRQARALAGETAKDKGRIVLSHRIEVEEADRGLLAKVYLRDAVAIED